MATVPTMTAKMTGTIPSTAWGYTGRSWYANREATAAATMPRGASQARKAFSSHSRFVPTEEMSTASGRTRITRMPRKTSTLRSM